MSRLHWLQTCLLALAALCLIGGVSSAPQQIRVYRLLDLGKPGVPTLTEDQRAWLKTVTADPFWKERLQHLWFAPTGKAKPLVLYYDDTVVRVTAIQGTPSSYYVVPVGSQPSFAGYATERSALVRIRNESPVPESAGTVSDVALQASPISRFAFDGGDLYFTDTQGHLVDRDVTAHRIRWVAPETAPFNAIALSGQCVYSIGPDETVIARDKRSGATLWKSARLHDEGNLSLTIAGKRLFALGRSITRIDPADGRILWQEPGSNFTSAIGLGDSLFVRLVSGDPPSESIAAMDAQTGKALAEYDPGQPIGTAYILGVRNGAVLVRAAGGGPTIDHDENAAARVVWLNGRVGSVLNNVAYRPDSALYGPDTGLAQPVFIDDDTIIFQVEDSIYRYRLDERPEDQLPLRLQNAGDLIAARNGLIYVRSSDGLYAVRLNRSAAVRRRVIAYKYDASLNQPALVVAATVIAVSDGKTISVLDLSGSQTHRYEADCGEVASIAAAKGRISVQCGSDSSNQTGTIFVAPL